MHKLLRGGPSLDGPSHFYVHDKKKVIGLTDKSRGIVFYLYPALREI